jgi:hypothetical protein
VRGLDDDDAVRRDADCVVGVNLSETEWARMVFVLQDVKPVVINGVVMEENLTPGDHSEPHDIQS